MFVKFPDGSMSNYTSSKIIHQSVYDKVTITYPANKVVYKTTTEKKQDTVVDADGKEHILRTYEVEVPVLEDGKPVVIENVREKVSYNPYNGYVIIPDDATILTEAEYQAELARLQPDTSTPTK